MVLEATIIKFLRRTYMIVAFCLYGEQIKKGGFLCLV